MNKLKSIYQNRSTPKLLSIPASVIGYTYEVDGHTLTADYRTEYLENADEIDRYFAQKYASLLYDPFDITLSSHESLEDFHAAQQGFFLSHKYKYDHLYASLNYTYNPIDNYDRQEHSTTDIKGKETDQLARTGQETDTNTHNGTMTDKLTKSGTETITSKEGNKENLQTNKNAPWDNADSEHLTGTVKDESKQTTDSTASTSFDNRTDNRTVTYNNDVNENVHSFTNRLDTNTKEYTNRQNVIDSRIHGNIGVTTSDQMLTAHRAAVNFSFWETVWLDLLEEFFIPVY